MLTRKIQEDILVALKSKDTKTVDVLRFLQSIIKNKEIEKHGELVDEEVIQIIRKQIKELSAAKELFGKGGRTDLVADNEAQIGILQSYLPTEISDEELRVEIERIIAENRESYEKNPRVLIGICVTALKSKASPARIIQILQKNSS